MPEGVCPGTHPSPTPVTRKKSLSENRPVFGGHDLPDGRGRAGQGALGPLPPHPPWQLGEGGDGEPRGEPLPPPEGAVQRGLLSATSWRQLSGWPLCVCVCAREIESSLKDCRPLPPPPPRPVAIFGRAGAGQAAVSGWRRRSRVPSHRRVRGGGSRPPSHCHCIPGQLAVP